MMAGIQHQIVQRAAERIEACPEAYDQQWWYRADDEHAMGSPSPAFPFGIWQGYPVDVLEMVECGTVACAATHIVCAALDLGIAIPEAETIPEAAALLTGLRRTQAGCLFHELTSNEAALSAIKIVTTTKSWDALNQQGGMA